MRGNTVESFFIWATNSLGIGELKKIYALTTEKKNESKLQHNFYKKDHTELLQIINKIFTYFLYKGDLPDMSDKNMITLQKQK